MTQRARVFKVFDGEAILAGGTAYSFIVPIEYMAGPASLQIELTGDGIAKVEWVGSNDSDALVAEFMTPNNANEITSGFTKTSGPGSDGKHIYPIVLFLVDRLAIKVTETGSSDPITVTAYLALK